MERPHAEIIGRARDTYGTHEVIGAMVERIVKEHRVNTTNDDLRIRAMRDDEEKAVREVMKKAFPFFMRLFFSVTKETFVAEKDGALAGGVVTKTFRINRKKKGGLVAFICTNGTARGLGLGQRLLDHALAYFEEQGCDEMFAAVEGTNTSSSKMFLTRGFAPASGGRLIKKYGFNVFRILFRTSHTFDLGHFLWIKPLADYRERPTAQWIANVLLNAVFWTAARTMWRGVASTEMPSIVLSVLVSIVLLLALRDVSTIAGSKLLGIPMQYRLWETGLLLNAVISLVFRGTFISTGAFYPTRKDWRYKDEYARLGTIAAISSFAMLAILYGAFLLQYLLALTPRVSDSVAMLLSVGVIFTIFDILIPIFPFYASNAGRVYHWSKPLWAILALLGVGVILLRAFVL